MTKVTSMGLKHIYVAPPNDELSLPAFGSAWEGFGDVLDDSANLEEGAPTKKVYKSQTSKKKIVTGKLGENKVKTTLMDPSLDLLARYYGGTVEGTDGNRTWKKPDKYISKSFAAVLIPEVGCSISSPSVTITPVSKISYSEDGIALLDVELEFDIQPTFHEEVLEPTKTA